jgi:hypothetical protein
LITLTDGPRLGAKLRVGDDGEIEYQPPDNPHWYDCVHRWRGLAREYPRDHALWVWLRAHGIRRPSPSGSRVDVPREQRRTPTARVELALSLDAAARLRAAAAAAGVSVSAWVASDPRGAATAPATTRTRGRERATAREQLYLPPSVQARLRALARDAGVTTSAYVAGLLGPQARAQTVKHLSRMMTAPGIAVVSDATGQHVESTPDIDASAIVVALRAAVLRQLL